MTGGAVSETFSIIYSLSCNNDIDVWIILCCLSLLFLVPRPVIHPLSSPSNMFCVTSLDPDTLPSVATLLMDVMFYSGGWVFLVLLWVSRALRRRFDETDSRNDRPPAAEALFSFVNDSRQVVLWDGQTGTVMLPTVRTAAKFKHPTGGTRQKAHKTLIFQPILEKLWCHWPWRMFEKYFEKDLH